MLNLQDMQFLQLKKYAKDIGLEIPDDINKKTDLIAFIKANEVKDPNDTIAENLNSFSALSLEELQDLAKERGFVLSGNEAKSKLIEMMTGETIMDDVETELEVKGDVKPPLHTKRTTIKSAQTVYGETLPGVIMDREFYRKHFEQYPKVRVIIPLAMGEEKFTINPDGTKVYPYENVSINGYAISIRKNVYVDVPKPFAEIIEQYTNFQVESEKELTGRPDVVEALI